MHDIHIHDKLHLYTNATFVYQCQNAPHSPPPFPHSAKDGADQQRTEARVARLRALDIEEVAQALRTDDDLDVKERVKTVLDQMRGDVGGRGGRGIAGGGPAGLPEDMDMLLDALAAGEQGRGEQGRRGLGGEEEEEEDDEEEEEEEDDE